MKLDFNETNILVRTIKELEENSKAPITKMKIIEMLYTLFSRTDKKYTILKVSVKSLKTKIDKLSDDDINQILADSKNNNIAASVCYHLPEKTSRPPKPYNQEP